MIPLLLQAHAEADAPFVVRLGTNGPHEAMPISRDASGGVYASHAGLFELSVSNQIDLDGDVLLVDPKRGRAERLFRRGSAHNTLLVTERCDQLCVMCSQPPKKSHEDRFELLTQACLLADPGETIGITGGEPTLFKEQLLDLIETVLAAREDLSFHVLTNGQHFEASDIERLRHPIYRRVEWGIPLYSAQPGVHDEIVAKPGAFARLEESMKVLLLAGAAIELRTVLLARNLDGLPTLARHITAKLGFVSVWSIMQLENIGFARNRWRDLYVDHRQRFKPIGQALDLVRLHGMNARLFNFALCSVPSGYRSFAAASISDWKRKFAPACDSCTMQEHCSGFFEWHPDDASMEVTPI
jgi:His-Xaa-Ser system radical SAM maturase HxsC